MIIEYFLRSIKQISRYRIRNGTIFISIILITVIVTALVNVAIKIHTLYEQEELNYSHKLKMIQIFDNTLTQNTIEKIKSIEGIRNVLPVTSMLDLPWINITLDGYQVLPSYIVYYNPEYAQIFKDKNLMRQPLTKDSGIIVSSIFRENVMSLEEFKSTFNVSDSVSQEFLDTSTSRLIKQYQEFNLSGPKSLTQDVSGKILSFKYEHKYLQELDTNSTHYEYPISGVIETGIINSNKKTVFIPGGYLGNVNPTYTTLHIQAENVESVEHITRRLSEMGYQPFSELAAINNMMDNRKTLLNQLLLIIGLIVLVSLFSLINAWQSILMERSREIAISKALGANSMTIIGSLIFENILIFGSATLVGLIIVTLIFDIIKNRIPLTDSHSEIRVIDIQPEAIRYLFEVPLTMYLSVFLITVGLGLTITYLLASYLFRKNIFLLIRKG